MISVNEALSIVANVSKNHAYKTLSLGDALNYILYEDVISPIDMPPFRQSAMDGYAIKWSEDDLFSIAGETKAGDSHKFTQEEGEAIRIFTGALVPDTADTVIIQEHVKRSKDNILIKKMPAKYANIRQRGEQISVGNTALKKGIKLNEAAIGFLACLGIVQVKVYKLPSVSILVTGSELQEGGRPLKPGGIYESNSIMLKAALYQIGIKNIQIKKIKDDYNTTEEGIENALCDSDLVLISGGISVGDYDFVKKALLANQVEELFYRVNQKPGKPLWFGKKDDAFVFALPGNPASVLTCFYVYVLPLIREIAGFKNYHLKKVSAKSISNFKNTSGKTLFLKAKLQNKKAELLTGQSSSMLNSFALSNAIVVIDESTVDVKVGDQVQCLLLEN